VLKNPDFFNVWLLMKGSGFVQIITDPEHTDPDPEHCAIKYLQVPTGFGSTTPAVYTAWKMPEKTGFFSFSS
jgi:hypothetical protein